MSAQKFAISVDVEDYFQVWAFHNVVARSNWDSFALRVGDSTRACLDLFDAHSARGTFFTLGWVAQKDPALIKEIVARGHELASHGYDHTKVNQQSRDAFKEDAGRTKTLLEDIGGAPVTGYRAAGFSIDKSTPWAHEVLNELGYNYSSSAHPIAHDHYGDAGGKQTPYQPLSGSDFVEAPVATVDVMGRRMSCAGGGWFRAMPYVVSNALIKRAANALDGPIIFYFHPWEIDPQQPRIDGASAKSRFRHYINLGRMKAKLARLLSAYQWGRIDEVLASHQKNGARAANEATL